MHLLAPELERLGYKYFNHVVDRANPKNTRITFFTIKPSTRHSDEEKIKRQENLLDVYLSRYALRVKGNVGLRVSVWRHDAKNDFYTLDLFHEQASHADDAINALKGKVKKTN